MDISKQINSPSFLIIGAQKAGTTALFNLLAQHPQILAPKVKEINYFQDDNNYRKGVDWYHAHFPVPEEFRADQITFEATPGYLYRMPVPERIFLYNRAIKLIILVRNPVDRAYSSWNMYKNFCNSPVFSHLVEHRSFEQAIGEELYELTTGSRLEYQGYVRLDNCSMSFPGYISRGLYYDQLTRYTKYFNKSQILIIDNYELHTDVLQVLTKIADFLNLDKFTSIYTNNIETNAGQYTSTCNINVAELLKAYFTPFNELLYKYVGIDYGW